MPSSFEKVKAWGRKCVARAKEADFLGEVALSRKELDDTLRLLAKFHDRLWESHDTRFALAIAAVNWAYYGPDVNPESDHHDGFVGRLTGRDGTVTSDPRWRRRSPIGEGFHPALEGPTDMLGSFVSRLGCPRSVSPSLSRCCGGSDTIPAGTP